MNKIVTVNAIILNEENKILAVKKSGSFLLPGGKMEAGENDLETLGRELKEEINTRLINALYFRTFVFDKALNEENPLEMRIYIAKIVGNPTPNNEISELIWLDKETYLQGTNFPKEWWNPIFAALKQENILSFDGSAS